MSRHRSLWLREALAGEPLLPSFAGDGSADVAIVGGGYVGLWTAIRIKDAEPGCDVAVVERDICGGGASGRNGGFVLPWWPKLETLVGLCGEQEGLRLARATESAVDELGEFCREHGIDAHYVRGGHLWTATTRAQLGAWAEVDAYCRARGVEAFVPLEPEEVAGRTGSPVHLAGVLEPHAATVHPGHLVRGLRRVALERGVRIFEGTRVRRIDRGSPAALHTADGRLTAGRVVLATNAWAAGLRELHTRLAVISSDIVVTAPVPNRLRELGWAGGECISDSQLQIHYYQARPDGRIVFGKGGWGIAFGGWFGRSFDRHDRRAEDVAADFRRIYPALSDVPVEDAWAGPIDRSAKGLPLIGRLGEREHLLYGVGWSGNGVGPALVGSRMLASLALGRNDEWSSSRLVDADVGTFPPEPARYVGAHLVRAAVARKERAEALGHRPARLASAISNLAPPGIIPKRKTTPPE
ncbi:MAG: FAD-binding oxidoreductase [Actinobacteria bacterium]|nr:FAD-binding oxidoreductase [Actinomycetota bacterium]